MDPLLLILKRLSDAGVPFVLIGAMAAKVHGSPVITEDVDVCIPVDNGTLLKVHAALWELRPRFRFRPDKMPVWEDPTRLFGIKNLNLDTNLGVIDLLGEVTGVGTYDEMVGRTVEVTVGGTPMRVLDLDALIAAKRAAGRVKDKQHLPHLEALRKRLRPDEA